MIKIDIEVGEYIRNKDGYIGKVERIIYDEIEKNYYISCKKSDVMASTYRENIVNHSFNILDLIELDDFVVLFDKELPAEYVYQIYEKNGNYLINSYEDVMSEDVKSIFTHEQLNEIEYRLEENNG